jgi:hypothetical protein
MTQEAERQDGSNELSKLSTTRVPVLDIDHVARIG